MCVRRLDTYSEDMGQSDLSRRIAHGDSGYPVLTILNPFFFVASPATSTMNGHRQFEPSGPKCARKTEMACLEQNC